VCCFFCFPSRVSLYNKITIVEKPRPPKIPASEHYYIYINGLHAPCVKCDLRFTGIGRYYIPTTLVCDLYIYIYDDPAVATCTTDYYQLSSATLGLLLYYYYYYYTPRNNIITCNFYISTVFLYVYKSCWYLPINYNNIIHGDAQYNISIIVSNQYACIKGLSIVRNLAE